MWVALGFNKDKSKQKLLKIILITIILSADVGRSIGIGNIVFYIVTVISILLIVLSSLTKSGFHFKYLKSEIVIYVSVFFIFLFIILYASSIRNIIHALKLFLIFFVVYPSIRSFFTEKEIILALKINIIINFLLIILGKLGFDSFSQMTGLHRGSTILNYAGSLYKVALLSLPYLIWDIHKYNKRRVINMLILIISMYIILFDGSRTGIIGIAIIVILYIFIELVSVIEKNSIAINSLMKGITAVLLIGTVIIKNIEKIVNTNGFLRGLEFIKLVLKFDMAELLKKGDQIRGDMILEALKNIQDNYLIFGNGFGNTTTKGVVIHNAYLQVFADLGIVAAICLILIILYPIIIGVWHVKADKKLVPSIISLVIFAFMLLLHPFSVQVSDWAIYLIPLSLLMINVTSKRKSS